MLLRAIAWSAEAATTSSTEKRPMTPRSPMARACE
jgi:hypothetical protein